MTWPLEIRDRIVELLEEHSLVEICADPKMPDRLTVQRWMREDANFATRCARAREMHAFAIVESITDIERGALDDVIKPEVARVVISSRQWRASKMNPKVFGDRTVVAGDPSAPLLGPLRTLTDEQLAVIAAGGKL